MAQELIKAAGMAAAAAAGTGDGTYPACPIDKTLVRYHMDDACTWSQARPPEGTVDRALTYERLLSGGTGATLVPNQRTITCPVDGNRLSIHDNPDFVTGFDSTWVVENTSSDPVAVIWIDHSNGGKEVSPYKPDLAPLEDPQTRLEPGQWRAIPVYEGFLYQVRVIDEEAGGGLGDVVLQHRAGLVGIGKASATYDCDPTAPDVEPVHPKTAERLEQFRRTPTHPVRRCNTIDVGFRNHVGCPLHVYWAGSLGSIQAKEAIENSSDDGFQVSEVKDGVSTLSPTGFQCAEQFRFHLGTKPATQEFMHDWESSTKFEGSLLTHTFVARLAADPNVIVDSYTLTPTKVVDCPNRKKEKATSTPELIPEAVQEEVQVPEEEEDQQEVEIDANGNLEPPRVDAHIGAARGGESGQM